MTYTHEDVAALVAATRRQVRNIEHWLDGGDAAGPEESKSIYQQMKDALEPFGGTDKTHPHNRDKKLKEFARIWLNGPLPADLMADLSDILDDEDYPPEKRAHQIVWQAIKWGMDT